ncbi:peptidase M28 [Haloferax elongans ATCC BAA-1513]|uniref:Carboxypeptidase Q n=1 Tax=Haloferax elongans ATCC BAA-1513 TaxID=1230453 RepID=M0HLQ7_HALEO|nr:M28 family metallopeptidase [Haloferax elongans]ELZ84652.1 peptidase M28 [Haloferax elongans ATCC BAA-1513]
MAQSSSTLLPTHVVGDAYTQTEAWEFLVNLADGPDRFAGTKGEEWAAQQIAEAFRSRGCDEVSIDEFQIPGWERGESILTAAGTDFAADHEVIALPGSPPETVSGEIVDCGHGLLRDFENRDLEGAIAMAADTTPADHGRHIHRLEKYAWAAEAGASAFIYRTDRPGSLPPTGDVGTDDGAGPIPAIGVSREVGAWLERRCNRTSIEGTVTVDCETPLTNSRNVSAALGPETADEILVTAHIDAHDIGSGANDNGVGCALLTETARLLSQVTEQLETRVRFVAFGAEEVGFRGSREYVREHDLDAVKAVVNADGIGYSRTIDLYTHGFDEIGAAFEAALDAFGVPGSINDAVRPHSDHWPFVKHGVPGVQLRSESEQERGWTHTHADTADKIDLRDLRDLAVVLSEAVLRLARSEHEVEHVDPSVIRDATKRAGLEAGLRATGDWPWE